MRLRLEYAITAKTLKICICICAYAFSKNPGSSNEAISSARQRNEKESSLRVRNKYVSKERVAFEGNVSDICLKTEALTTNVRKAKQFWPVRSL
jgi:hypothetical protein